MKKIAFIGIAVVAALATLGIGFSMWSQTVTVNGSVATGKVSVALNKQFSNDPASSDGSIGTIYSSTQLDPKTAGNWHQNTDGTWYWTGPTWDKNVADIVCQQNSPPNDNSMSITVNNGYPGYIGEILIGVTNTGTIPVGINGGFKLTASGTSTVINSMTYDNAYFVEPSNGTIKLNEISNNFEDIDGDAAYTITVSPVPLTSLVQIDPGQTGWFIVDVNVMETNPPATSTQNQAYTFTLTAMFSQWNETN